MKGLLSFLEQNLIEAGCDEAGRGCLSGPVVAASVILPKDFYHPLLNDSKKLSEKNRFMLRPIIEREAIAFGVAFVSNETIDEINILKASILGMHLALDQLKIRPELLLIDGNKFFPYQNIPHRCIVKGDAKFLSIAAASVLAKTYRDDFMYEAHEKYPVYNWKTNKGYATRAHRDSIEQNGPSPLHRKTFQWFKSSTQKQDLNQLELF